MKTPPAFLAAALLAVLSPDPAAAAPEWRIVQYEHVLGTSLELRLAAADADAALAAEDAVLREIDRLGGILSGYDRGSEFSRWMSTRGSPEVVSRELREVLGLFDLWRERTGGALDAAAEVAGQLWRQAEASQRVPGPAELAAAVGAVQQTHWRLEADGRSVTHLSTAPLRLNSFAKSYIIDRAAAAALATGRVGTVVVNLGGDLVVRGRDAETIAITDPEAEAENETPVARVAVRDRAVATSGGYRRGVTIGGVWYSHLVDPRTGRPVSHVHSATVSSPSATDAGALATALCVLEPAAGLRLVASQPGAECLMILADGRRLHSPGWSSLAVESPSAVPQGTVVHAAPNSATGASSAGYGAPVWDPAFELSVNLEIASPAGGRAKRPFVAVWIEDKDQFPIRTLALWYHGARWLPDLRAWTHADHLRSMAEGTQIADSIAGATRGPGKYTVRWDGKDATGKPVRLGTYTVAIEIAREHGTHQLIRREVTFDEKAQHIDLPANVELKAVSLDYGRKSSTR